ncbi:hypothetical protein [Modestobacter marinus]|uniref:hypothetical protein n=1 Tax=Modestobacter marinus TaxID=477641 RepID=UPI0021BBD21E|nr:hypothetical protein [Modestobacter marinus]
MVTQIAMVLSTLGIGALTRGRHVQVGLLPRCWAARRSRRTRWPPGELAVLGSHGMAAADYPAMLSLISAGRLRPELQVTRELALADAGPALAGVGGEPGIAVVSAF